MAELPAGTEKDICRIILMGEADEAPDMEGFRRALEDRFCPATPGRNPYPSGCVGKGGDDTLRGIFLRMLRERLDGAKTGEERELCEQAARWGLAALDNREEVRRHENP